MSGNVKVRPAPVRFHVDCLEFSAEGSKCMQRGCKVMGHELACKDIKLRFEENHEAFRCTHCGVKGPAFKSTWIRTEFMSDGTPVDVYKCETCLMFTVLYQTAKAQKCKKLEDVSMR